MATTKIAVLVGSLRKESLNRKVAQNLIKMAPDSMKLEIVEIGDLSLYNEDLDTENPPKPWSDFRAKMLAADAFIFVTPEYNRSIPGVLKNAIDVASRPPKNKNFDGKPGAVISVTPGSLGAFGANHVLRQSMVFLNVPMMQQPEMYIADAKNIFNDDGSFVERTEKYMQSFLSSYEKWISRFI